MINVSSAFKEAMKTSRRFKAAATLTLASGQEIELGDEDIIIGGNSLTDAAGADTFPVGEAISRAITLEILNDTEQYADVDFLGATINLSLVFAVSDTSTERIELGTFTVTEPEEYGETVTVTAHDDMWRADVPYETKLSFPATLSQMFRDICMTCGIGFSTSDFVNSTFVVNVKPDGDYTARQMLGYIAALAGGNARINRAGKCEILTYDLTDSAAVHELNDVIDISADTDDILITGVQTTVTDADRNERKYISGEAGYVITIDNPLISGKEQTAVDLIGERLIGATFRKFSGSLPAYPTAEFMDGVRITDRRGRTYRSVITDMTFTFFGETELACSAESAVRRGSAYPSLAAGAVAEARKLVAGERTARETAIAELAGRLSDASGLYITVEPQPDKSSIYYMHNKPTLEESDIVWKLTSEAFGISTDGGKSYPYGFTVTGEMITRLLYAEGIDADYINSGSIVARDAKGNIVFSVNVETGEVIISGDSVRIGSKSATQALADTLAESKSYTDGELIDYAKTVTSSIDNLQAQIDGAIESHYYSYAPTLDNIPASEWTTETERQKHEGDLFYDKSTGYAYRFFKDGNTWKWQPIQDTDIVKALQTAEKAQDTADGKRRNFLTTPTPPYDEGDQWTDGDDIKTCVTAKSKDENFAESDWQKLNKYTDDTVANQALDEARKSANLTIVLGNEYEGIPTDHAGAYTPPLSASTTVQVYYGHADVSAACTYTQTTSAGVTGGWDGATRTYTVTALSADTGWVDITANYLMFSVTKRFSVAKIKSGVPGAKGDKGEPGASYSPNLAQRTNQGVTNWWWFMMSGEFTAEEVEEDGIRCCKLTRGIDAFAGWSVIMYTDIGRKYYQPGKKYTVSFEVRSNVTTYINCDMLTPSGVDPMLSDHTAVKNSVLADTWSKCVYVVTTTDPLPASDGHVLYMTGMDSSPGVSYTFRNLMITEGEDETSWAPSTEDMKGPAGAPGAPGPQGPAGEAGRTYMIEMSANVLKRGANNAITPVTLTASAYYRDGTSAERAAYSGRWQVSVSSDGVNFSSVAVSGDSASYSVSPNSFVLSSGTIVAVRFTLYAAGGTSQPLDMQTVPVVVDVDALSHEQIFNLLTDNGRMQGIYQEGGDLYINGAYIKAGTVSADKLAAGSITLGNLDAAIQGLINGAARQIYHTADAWQGRTGYFRFAQIRIGGYYQNAPIKIGGVNRSGIPSTLWITFANADHTDPVVAIFAKSGTADFYIAKTGIGTWDLYVRKTEGYDNFSVTEYEKGTYMSATTVTWLNEYAETLPEGYITAAQTIATAEWCYNNDITYINGGKIYTGTVTANAIAAGAVTAEKISAGAINADKLAAGAVTADAIAAGAITSDKISVSTLSAIAANLGTVTAGVIQSANYAPGVSGMKLTLADGVWDSPNFKVSSTGEINATSGTIGGWKIGDHRLYSDERVGYSPVISCEGLGYIASGRIATNQLEGMEGANSYIGTAYYPFDALHVYDIYAYEHIYIGDNELRADKLCACETGTVTPQTLGSVTVTFESAPVCVIVDETGNMTDATGMGARLLLQGVTRYIVYGTTGYLRASLSGNTLTVEMGAGISGVHPQLSYAAFL